MTIPGLWPLPSSDGARWGKVKMTISDLRATLEAGPRGGMLTVSEQCSEGSQGHSLREDAQAQAWTMKMTQVQGK